MKSLQSRYGLLLLGIGLGLASWIVDSVADWLWFSPGESFADALSPDEPVEIWMRLLILLICCIMGHIAQRTYNHQRALAEALAASNAALAAARDAAEVASQAKSAFLAKVSHELRTPMHAILSFAQLGRDRHAMLAAGKSQQYFSHIHDSGMRLLVLLDDLLDLSRIEAGRMSFSFEMIDIVSMIAEVCEENQALLSSRRLRLALPVNTGIQLKADRLRLAQVLQNLLSNAIRHSPPDGEIRFEVAPAMIHCPHRACHTRPTPACAIRILDEGTGIPEGEAEAIFENFVQGSTAPVTGGTGLGLAIVREIITAHGGHVHACNREPRGALFEILLPASHPA